MYTVRGMSGSLSNGVIAQLWNPHSTQRIKVVWGSLYRLGSGATGDNIQLRRSTARGTPGSTVTPDIDNHCERAVAPPSGVELDLSQFSVQPTLEAEQFGFGWVGPFMICGFQMPFKEGIIVPPGTGLCMRTPSGGASWNACEISFFWMEDWMPNDSLFRNPYF